MPVYEYTALDVRGKSTSGIIDADNSLAVRQKLRSANIYPISISEVAEPSATSSKRPDWLNLSRLWIRIRPAEVAMLTRQLAVLIKSGFPLVGALNALVATARSPRLERLLVQVKTAVSEGNSFAAALSGFPRTFPELYVSMVRAGESSGTLEIVLDRLADIMERQMALKHRIRAALAYPVLMTIVGLAVLCLLLVYIVPTITSIFSDAGQVLPTPTRLLIFTSNMLQSYGWVLAVLLLLALACYSYLARTPKGSLGLDHWKLKIPMLGSIWQKLAVARFTRTLGSLLENGVTMLSALRIVKSTTGNHYLAASVENAAVEIGKGQSLGAALSQGDAFPALAIQMIQTGEQSGALETMLERISEVFETETEMRILRMTSLLEPVMILVMGVVIGFVVMAICMPIFEMSQLVL
jgi:general secretion pathway protein F